MAVTWKKLAFIDEVVANGGALGTPSSGTLTNCTGLPASSVGTGLGNVENKSSATIRGEITSGNVTTALGFTPVSVRDCKAWANFNGTGTVAIRASFNVSSITDNGTGDYTVNFTSAMADANYSAVIGGGSQTAAAARVFMEQHDSVLRSTTQLRLYTLNAAFGTADTSVVCVSIFR